MLTLPDTAVLSGLSADYVLFDCWFANPAQITAIKSRDIDVIAMVRKSSRIKYSYNGESLNIKEIYSRNKKRRGQVKIPAFCRCHGWKRESDSSPNSMRPEQRKPKGLARFSVYESCTFRRRDHPNLWQMLAD